MAAKKDNDLNYATIKLIEQYSKMDIDTLGRHIAQNIVHFKLDVFFNIFNALLGDNSHLNSGNVPPPKYPKIYEGDSEFVHYIKDIQNFLCKDRWLCNKMDSITQLPYNEQVIQLSAAIRNHPNLEKWQIAPLPVAVLLIRIGIKRFYGCE